MLKEYKKWSKNLEGIPYDNDLSMSTGIRLKLYNATWYDSTNISIKNEVQETEKTIQLKKLFLGLREPRLAVKNWSLGPPAQ